MSYLLPEIPYLKLQFILRAEEDSTLPPLKASMLRGAFGHALRRTVCVMGREQECETCMLRSQCVYTRIFEPFIETDPPPFCKGLNTAPRPFIIDAVDKNTGFQQGDPLKFHLTLIGKICELHPYVIFAFSRAAERGFTRKRYKFTVQQINSFTPKPQKIYDGTTQTLIATAIPQVVSPDGPLDSPLVLKFLSPTRLKFRNQLSIDFTFRMLVFKMLRRILELAYFYVPNSKPDWNFHDFLERADKVEITNKKLYWEEIERYSNRQQSKLLLGGFFGEITLDGNLEPFNHLLRISEVLHVGKGTVFGLGKVRVEG